jgi:arabinofuranosyltransferase
MYIVYIGGDFMAGRFLTAPFLLAGIQLARANLNKPQLLMLALSIGILGAMSIHTTLLSDSSYKNRKISNNGIADERGYYFQKWGLLNETRAGLLPPPYSSTLGEKPQIACAFIGAMALNKGPGRHYLDKCALTDPLLSHLPAKKDAKWRIGHFARALPENYTQSLFLNKNLLTDPLLYNYYNSIRKITRGNLNDPSRWREIIRLNFQTSGPYS